MFFNMARPALKEISLQQIQSRAGAMNKHPLYNTWRGMLERCHSINSISYERYGGKGISVFEEWRNKARHPQIKRWSLGFCLFLEYVENNLGEKKEGYSLDRINSSLGYGPGNLRWADASLQKKNQKVKNQTGYKYVYAIANSTNWQVEYKVGKKRIYLGVFKTKEEAYFAALASRLETMWPKDL
jgi:hypothetical protein